MPFPVIASQGGSAVVPVSRSPGSHLPVDAPRELPGVLGTRVLKASRWEQEPPARAVTGNDCVCFSGGGLPKKVSFHHVRKLENTQWVKPCQIKQTGDK